VVWADYTKQDGELVAIRLGVLDADFEVIEPLELVACLERLATRYTAVGRASTA
jgi:hypothetical protein